MTARAADGPDPARPHVTAVVVHYGDPVPTVQLAGSLQRADTVVVVVANDGRPRPAELAADVQWLLPERNLGYGDAFNVAIAGRDSDIFAVFNTDLTMPRATFDRCVQVLDHRPDAGIVGPLLRRPDGSLQSGAGLLTRWLRRPRVLTDPGPVVAQCVWVTGAAMFIRAAVARDPGMDGSYFLGAEDVDLCVRAGRAGWRVLCCGDAVATHEGSRLIAGPRWTYYTVRNRVWWAKANYGAATAVLNWLAGAAAVPRIAAADLLKRSDLTSTRLALLGLRHALRAKPSREAGSLVQEPFPARVMHW